MDLGKMLSSIQGAKAATGIKGAAEGHLMKHAYIQRVIPVFQAETGCMRAVNSINYSSLPGEDRLHAYIQRVIPVI